MKYLSYILLLAALLFQFSCDRDDDDDIEYLEASFSIYQEPVLATETKPTLEIFTEK